MALVPGPARVANAQQEWLLRLARTATIRIARKFLRVGRRYAVAGGRKARGAHRGVEALVQLEDGSEEVVLCWQCVSRTGAMSPPFVLPELDPLAKHARPLVMQPRQQVYDGRGGEGLLAAVLRPRRIVVLRPEAMNCEIAAAAPACWAIASCVPQA